MSNQVFRNQWAQATVHELTCLMRACSAEMSASETTDLRREVISIAMIMLWTGSSLESVKADFRWLNGGKKRGDKILGYE